MAALGMSGTVLALVTVGGGLAVAAWAQQRGQAMRDRFLNPPTFESVQVGDQLLFFGAAGGPGNGQPIEVLEKFATSLRYFDPSLGGEGTMQSGFIQAYRDAGGTVEWVGAPPL